MTRLLVAAFAFGFLALAVLADEVKIPVDKLPKKVVDAVKAKFPDAKLVAAEKETTDGKTSYEVGIESKGKKIDVVLKEDGTIDAIEMLLDVKDLPKAVTAAIEAKYPKATLKKAEEVTKGDKKYIEVVVVTADKKTVEVEVDAKGKILNEEKIEKKEEKK
jgi:hypothetical protein